MSLAAALQDREFQKFAADGSVNVTIAGGSVSVTIPFSGTTGAAVPAAAGYQGLNVAGNLVGATGVNPSGTVYAQQMDLTSVGGTTFALGQALMAASIPVTLASNQSALAVTGTFFQATQPVSGTVTANAGTNLNTSLLALESGGNLATLAGAITAAVMQSNVKQINGITPLMGNGVTGTGSQRVTIASDNTAFSVNATLAAETTKVIGTVNISAGQTIAAVTAISNALPAGSNVIGHVIADTGSTTAVTGNVASTVADGANVTLGSKADAKSTATDTTAITIMQVLKQISASVQAPPSQAVTNAGTFAVQAAGDTASGATDAGNPLKIGAVAHTAAPTAVTDGQRVNLIADKVGKLITSGAIRDLKTNQKTTITSSTAETTILTAVASTFLDVYGIVIANTSATATSVTIKDSTSGTTRFIFRIPASETRGFMVPVDSAHPQATVNNNWTATCADSVASIEITVLAVKNI